MNILDFVVYDEDSPTRLRWNVNKGPNIRTGSVAGTICKSRGYAFVTLGGRQHQVQRVVWQIFNGEIPNGMTIDHIDMDRSNNSIENLRMCSQSENMMNRKVRSTSKTGVKGVHWESKGNRFVANVCKNGVRYRKVFHDLEEANVWVKSMREELHGDFCRH